APGARANEMVLGKVKAFLSGTACAKMVAGNWKDDPVRLMLEGITALKDVAQCRAQATESLLCALPEMVGSAAAVLKDVAQAIWDNKSRCAAVTLAAVGVGAFSCGIVHAYGPKLVRASACLSSALGSGDVWTRIQEIVGAKGAPEALKAKVVAAACKFL